MKGAVKALMRAWPTWVIPGVVMAFGIIAAADLYGASGEAERGPRQESGTPAGATSAPSPVPPITANPNATPDTKAVLEYLLSLPSQSDNRVIVGQHAGDSLEASIEPFESIHSDTGQWPGLLSADYVWSHDYTRVNSLAKSYWRSGGLITISYHMPNLWTGGDFTDRNGINIPGILQPGTSERELWLAELDYLAAALGDLEDAGVVVLWRPFHEMNGTWFWWGGSIPDDFKALWQDMFRYLTEDKGLGNLLWVYSPDAGQAGPLDWYPGSEYVDVVGLDVYLALQRNCTTLTAYSDLLTLGKPLAITEFGAGLGGDSIEPYNWRGLIGCIKSAHPQAVYFMVWSGEFGLHNDLHLDLDDLVEDPWIVNRSEVSWRPEPPLATFESSDYTDPALP